VGISRSVARHVRRRDEKEKHLRQRIRDLAARHKRYGYRRIAALLTRSGERVNHKRVHRIWKDEGLQLAARRPKRRRCGRTGEFVNKAQHKNHVWSYDFVEDRTETGNKLRMLVVLDEYTRECLQIRVERSTSAAKVIDTMNWLFLLRGVPEHIRSDNGPEFVARALCEWLDKAGCGTIFINPGSPWENAYVESFNDKFRDECLNREIFRSGREAREVVESWRVEYNEYRPHSSLGWMTPVEFSHHCASSSRPPVSLRFRSDSTGAYRDTMSLVKDKDINVDTFIAKEENILTS